MTKLTDLGKPQLYLAAKERLKNLEKQLQRNSPEIVDIQGQLDWVENTKNSLDPIYRKKLQERIDDFKIKNKSHVIPLSDCPFDGDGTSERQAAPSSITGGFNDSLTVENEKFHQKSVENRKQVQTGNKMTSVEEPAPTSLNTKLSEEMKGESKEQTPYRFCHPSRTSASDDDWNDAYTTKKNAGPSGTTHQKQTQSITSFSHPLQQDDDVKETKQETFDNEESQTRFKGHGNPRSADNNRSFYDTRSSDNIAIDGDLKNKSELDTDRCKAQRKLDNLPNRRQVIEETHIMTTRSKSRDGGLNKINNAANNQYSYQHKQPVSVTRPNYHSDRTTGAYPRQNATSEAGRRTEKTSYAIAVRTTPPVESTCSVPMVRGRGSQYTASSVPTYGTFKHSYQLSSPPPRNVYDRTYSPRIYSPPTRVPATVHRPTKAPSSHNAHPVYDSYPVYHHVTEPKQENSMRLGKLQEPLEVKTVDVPEVEEQPLELLDMHQYFSDDFDLTCLGPDVDKMVQLEVVEAWAKKYSRQVASFSEAKYSLEYFVLDEKLMRLIEHLDKLACKDDPKATSKKVEVIEYIKNLHKTLDSQATED